MSDVKVYKNVIEVNEVLLNLSKISHIDFYEKFLHLHFKFKENKEYDIRDHITFTVTKEDYLLIRERFKSGGEVMRKVITVKDLREDKEFDIDLSSVVKLNVGKDRKGRDCLFVTEHDGANTAYYLSSKEIEKVRKEFRGV